MARQGFQIDGVRLGRRRTELALTQQLLADKAHIHRTTLAKIEGGSRSVSLQIVERLAAVLGCSREWLLGEPEQADEFDLARDRIASAMTKMADGFEDFTAAVEALEQRARDVAAGVHDQSGEEVRA